MKVALVCIAKNEDLYIEEWVNYHLKLGFDKIYVYQNDWICNFEKENLIKYKLDGNVQQRNAYNNFIQTHNDEYDWVAFFDVDEFLVLKKYNNVKRFIEDYSQYSAIGINWVLFGDNGLENTGNDFSLLKRFTKRQKNVNFHVKCIVKLNKNVIMDIHNPNCEWVDTNYVVHRGPFNKQGNDEVAQLNHYFCKTKSEFELKCERGRADTLIYKRNMTHFDEHNFNEIEDFQALNFFYNI